MSYPNKEFEAEMNIGISMYNSKNYNEAFIQMNNILKMDISLKEESNVYYSRGMISMDLENYDSAISDFSIAYEIFPFTMEKALFQRALAYTRNKKYIKALHDLDEVKGSEFEHSFIEDCKKEIRNSIDDYILNNNNLGSVDDMLFNYWKGEYYRTNEAFNEAINEYSLFMENFHKNIENRPHSRFYLSALNSRGHCFKVVKEYEKAISDLHLLGQKSSEFDGYYHSDIYLYIGEMYFKLEDYDRALKCINYCISKSSNIFKNHYIKAQILYATSEYHEAFTHCTKCMELDPTNSAPIILRSKIKEDLEDYLGSIDDVSKAIELDENKGELFYSRAILYKKMNKSDGFILNDMKIASTLGIKEARDFLESLLD